MPREQGTRQPELASLAIVHCSLPLPQALHHAQNPCWKFDINDDKLSQTGQQTSSKYHLGNCSCLLTGTLTKTVIMYTARCVQATQMSLRKACRSNMCSIFARTL